MRDIQLWHGDCFSESLKIPPDSVDLILTDPPFGIMKGQGKSPAARQFGFKNCEWDQPLDPIELFTTALRLLRVNGKLVLFSQEPYTSKLITSALPSLPFSYRAIWEKETTGNHLKSNKAMLNFFEDILIFKKKNDTNYKHPLIPYARWMIEHINKKPTEISRQLKVGKIHFLSAQSSQLCLPSENLYDRIVETYGLSDLSGFRPYSRLKDIENRWKSQNLSVFNKWEGGAYKSNILKYRRDVGGYHPTQKPIALLSDIIKTFSNENDLVVDLTAGSGSTAIACRDSDRDCICIEKDVHFFEVARKRLSLGQFIPSDQIPLWA